MRTPADDYVDAVNALNRGQWAESWQRAQRLLAHAPGHAGVHFVAGVSALQLRAMPEAIGHLRRAVAINPERPDYQAQLARALADARILKDAVEAAGAAMALSPHDPLTLDTLGVVFSQAHAHPQAAEAFRKAVALVPDRAGYRFNLATCLMYAGDIDGAQLEYEECLALDPKHWKAYLALSQLRKQLPAANHVSSLETLLEKHADDADAALYLNLALAKELEDLGDYSRAFAHYTFGKSSQRSRRGYDSARDEAIFDAIAAMPSARASGYRTDEPIFVFGMPRSGTTLVDRILSSHSDVRSAGELQEFGLAVKRLSGSRTPGLLDADTLQRAAGIAPETLGRTYIENTRPGTGQSPRFVDKLPHNFLYAGLIASALPDAKMICLRRNPLDTCLSNFRQLFALRSPYYDYSFDLMDTGRYYVMFDRLVAHWRDRLGARLLEIEYEALVEDQAGSTAKLLEFCGLPWEDACMAFEKNPAAVSTASAVQVREPMNRASLGRRERYGKELAPLRALLEEAGILT